MWFRIQYVILFPLTLLELFCIWIYRRLIRYSLQKSCNFIPTCSKYAWDSVLEFGAVYGTILATKRLMHCNPNKKAGYDFAKLNIHGNYKWKC